MTHPGEIAQIDVKFVLLKCLANMAQKLSPGIHKFYSCHSFYSCGDIYKQLKVHLSRSNNSPMRPLSFLSHLEFLDSVYNIID